MRINIVAVGRLKEKYFADAVAEYAKRMGAYCDFRVIEVPAAPPAKSANEQKETEGAELLTKASGCVIALDGRGKKLSSPALAELIKRRCSAGDSEFSFLIGGSHGLSDGVLARADETVSFGEMTFPHQLFRVMLAEQLYRAMTINAGTPYHK